MKYKNIRIDGITSCFDCPFYEWVYSDNSADRAFCNKSNRILFYDDHNLAESFSFPEWCEFPSQVKLDVL